MLELPSKLLHQILRNTLPRNPLWAVLILNEYLQQDDPLRKSAARRALDLIAQHFHYRINKSAQEQILNGMRASELDSPLLTKVKNPKHREVHPKRERKTKLIPRNFHKRSSREMINPPQFPRPLNQVFREA